MPIPAHAGGARTRTRMGGFSRRYGGGRHTHTTIPWEPRKYCAAIGVKRSCPAESQICMPPHHSRSRAAAAAAANQRHHHHSARAQPDPARQTLPLPLPRGSPSPLRVMTAAACTCRRMAGWPVDGSCTVLFWKSTPIVAVCLVSKVPHTNCRSKHVLPTPKAPRSTTLDAMMSRDGGLV
jgi:hypothetical protein